MSVNKVILIGRVGQDPEIRSTQDGREIANVSIATSESWKDKNTGERKTKTEWHRVVVFSPALVGVIKSYIKKGSQLYIEGALQTRKWTDQSGAERYSTEVVLQGFGSSLTMLDSKGDTQSGYQKHNEDKSNGYQPQSVDNDSVPDFDDEPPF